MGKSLTVIKYGGSAMTDVEKKRGFLEDIAKLKSCGENIVIVHGGGPEINGMLKRVGKMSEFVEGNRVSDVETVEIAEMVLSGKLNKSIVTQLNNCGIKAVGLSGKDGNMITAKKKYLNIDGKLVDIGFVGEVVSVDTELLTLLLENGYLPVISTIGKDNLGNTYNINADYVAGEIAGALGAERLLMFTDVDGIYMDFEDKGSLIPEISKGEVLSLIEKKVVSGGMLPKVRTCLDGLSKGVERVVILNGKLENIVDRYFSGERVGTTIKN